MAFQITQCPSCNSTFNTSPQMLKVAAGKVRCGACLCVFQASEHFVDVAADGADESVFIGNHPEDFFDPAVFLTRSALQDDQASSDQQDLTRTASKTNPDPLTESETELHEREVPERQDRDSEKPKDSEPSISASQSLAEGENKNPKAHALTEGSKAFSPALETQNDQVKTDPEYLANDTKADPINESKTWAGTEAEVGVEVEVETKVDPESNTAPRITFENEAETKIERADFFAALEESLYGLEATDEIEELKAIDEPDAFGSASNAATTAQIKASTTVQQQVESEAEPVTGDIPAGQTSAELPASDDSDIGQNAPTEPASVQRPEDVSLSISFSVQPRPNVLSVKTAAANGVETQDKRDHAEQVDINRNGSASDSDLAEVDAKATIATEIQGGMGSGRKKQDSIAENNSSINELPLKVGEAAIEPVFRKLKLDSTTEFSENTSSLKPDKLRAAELAEQDINKVIAEPKFADTVASGFAAEESIDSEPDSSINLHLARVEGESDHPNTGKHEGDRQSQGPLQASDSTQSIEHHPSELDGETTEEENWLAGLDAASPNSVDPHSEQSDLAQYSITHSTAPLIERTEPSATETHALIRSDENEAGEISAIDTPPKTEQDKQSDQASADAATQHDQAENQESAFKVEVETEVSSEDIRTRAMRAKLRDDEALEQLPEENLAALKVIGSPLELGSAQSRRWGATLGLALLTCLLGAGMAAQYLWRHNAAFSQEPKLRPLFASACQILGCSLEPYSDPSSIVSSNLAVRSHPERADAIMVNVEMRNTAPLEQSFPIMVLGFNTANNDLIALREFTPEEYLDSGLRHITQMPVMIPVQIDLALMDPGNDAVNYTLAFRHP